MSRPDMDGWTLAHRFRIDQPTVLLNVWQRMHWAARKRHQEMLAWLIVHSRKGEARPATLEECRIHIIRGNPKPFPDQDGLIGGLKPLIDCLVDLGYIVDDNPSVVQSLTAESVKAPRNKGFTEVEIWTKQ